MKSLVTTRTARGALRRNLLHTMLATLGIVIGVAAVISMMEISNGATIAIKKTMASIGANTLVSTSGINQGAGSVTTLSPRDADAIIKECPALVSVAPIARPHPGGVREPQLGYDLCLWHHSREVTLKEGIWARP